MKDEKDEILNHAWELFTNLSDDSRMTESLLDAIYFFAREHNFDILELPRHLLDEVNSRFNLDANDLFNLDA